jgi:hypothetical protein
MTMTTTYSGPARLILVDGACISGMASLSSNQRGGLNGWGATFRPDEITTDFRNAVPGLQLELPYDRVGTVAVTGGSGPGSPRTATVGSWPAPCGGDKVTARTRWRWTA